MLLALVYAALQFVFMWWLSAYSYNVDSAAAAVEAGALGGGLNDAVVAEVAGGAGGAAVAAAVRATPDRSTSGSTRCSMRGYWRSTNPYS